MAEIINTQSRQALASQATVKSFVKLFDKITLTFSQQDKEAINKLINQDLKENAPRLGQALNVFKRVQNIDSLKQDALNLKEKWYNKLEISNYIRDHVLVPFAEGNSLDVKTAFMLLDEFFSLSPQRLSYFNSLQNSLDDVTRAMNQMQQPQNFQFDLQSNQRRYEIFRSEMLKHSAKILFEANQNYFNERNYLFRCLVLLINQANSNGINSSRFDDYVQHMLVREQKLAENLLDGLIRNLEFEKEFTNLFNSELLEETQKITDVAAREQLLDRLQHEQIEQLKLLFSFYFKSYVPKASEVNQMLRYLKKSNFTGQLVKSYRTVEQSEKFLIQQELIAGLGKITSLCMLKIHKINLRDARGRVDAVVGPQDKEVWSQVINTQDLTEASSVFYFAIVKMACLSDRSVKEQNALERSAEVIEFYREMKSQSSIYEIQQLMHQQVFCHDSLKSIKGSLYNVIKAWLNIVFPFFKENKMEEEMHVTRSLSMNVLRNDQNVKAVWAEYDANGRDSLQKSLQMFESCLKSPINEIHGFLRLSETLCGKKHCPFAGRVFEFISQQSENFLKELLGWCVENITKLDNNYSTAEEVESLASAFVIFAKIVKQTPNQYDELNRIYLQVIEMYRGNGIKFSFENSNRRFSNSPAQFLQSKPELNFDEGSNPFLRLMVRALHSFFNINFEYSKRVITNLIDALSSIYTAKTEMRMEIIDMFQLQSEYSSENMFTIVEYFSKCFIQNENTINSFKTSESFIRLLCKIFESNFPQECLGTSQLMQLSTSFIAQSLEYVYLPIIQNYQDFQFKDTASLGNFTFMLLKLTRILLEKLIEIPQSQKAHLLQPTPKFDYLLQIIAITLNKVQLERMCYEILQLQEQVVGSNQNQFKTIYSNKFLNNALHQSQQSDYQLKKLRKMIIEAIATINTVIKLAIVEDDQQSQLLEKKGNYLDVIALKTNYVMQLNCVQNLKSQILDSNRAETLVVNSSSGASISHSIFSLFVHYVQASEFLGFTQIQSQAVQFLTLICQLWKSKLSENKTPNLQLLLKQDSLSTQQQKQEILSQKLLQTIKRESINGQFALTLRFVDLLIIAADTQPKFLDMILASDDKIVRIQVAESFINLIKSNLQANANEEGAQQAIELKTKLIILFSLISKRRLCIDMISHNDYEIVKSLHKYSLEQVVFKSFGDSKIKFNGDYIQPYQLYEPQWLKKKLESENKCIHAYNICLAKVGVCYFMKLLVAEYSRDPSTKVIRKLIVDLFKHEKFKSVPTSSAESKSGLSELFAIVKQVNYMTMTNTADRNLQLQEQQYDRVHNDYSQILQQHATSALISQNGGVHIESLFSLELFENLQANSSLYQLVIGSETTKNQMPLFAYQNPGCLGTEFYVSTKELKYVMEKEFFNNICFINQVQAIFQEFNLALSSLHTDIALIKEKQDFILQIGKVTLKENQPGVNRDLLIQSSLIPLVTADSAVVNNDDQLMQYSNQLLKGMLDQSNVLFQQLINRPISSVMYLEESKSDLAQNYYMLKLNECQIDSLTTFLIVITSQIRSVNFAKKPIITKLDFQLRKDLEKLVVFNMLPNLCDMFDFNCEDFATGVSQANLKTKIKYQLRMTEQAAFELFVQLAFQTLQIFQVINEAKQDVATNDVEKKKQDLQIIKILSKVIESLRKDIAFERCLQIFQISFDLIDSNNMQMLMRKQDNLPIREVIQKLNGNQNKNQSFAIIQLLTSYAQTEQGAEHLKNIRILEELSKSDCLRHLDGQELYITTQGQTSNSLSISQVYVRNPFHIQWCQILVLLRTLNNQLLEDPLNQHSDYFIQLVQLMQVFKQRFTRVLHFGIQLARIGDAQYNVKSMNLVALVDDNSNTMMSIALLEETELIMDILSQMFEYGHLWMEKDAFTFAEMKDYSLFIIPKLLAYCESRQIQALSETEHRLQTVTISAMDRGRQAGKLIGDRLAFNESENSALSLKAEISLARISMTNSYSILNCLLLTKEGINSNRHHELIQTWYDLHQLRVKPSQVLNQNFTKQVSIAEILRFAFDSQFISSERMFERLLLLQRTKDQGTQKVFKNLAEMFHNDQQIQLEYSGGMNSTLCTNSEDALQEVSSLIETGIHISLQVNCLLLELLRDCLDQSQNNNYAYQTNSVDERRDIVRKAQDLRSLIEKAHKECSNFLLAPNFEEEQIDKEFFDKLEAATIAIEKSVTHSGGYYQGMMQF